MAGAGLWQWGRGVRGVAELGGPSPCSGVPPGTAQLYPGAQGWEFSSLQCKHSWASWGCKRPERSHGRCLAPSLAASCARE